jgi:transcriptional regulator with XRE-family HTH domain
MSPEELNALVQEAHVAGVSAAVQEANRCVDDPRRISRAWRIGQGTAIRFLRMGLAIGLRDLARQVGVPPSAVTAWETGEAMAKPEHIQGMARVFGVPYGVVRTLGLPSVSETRDPVAERDPWATGTDSLPSSTPTRPDADDSAGAGTREGEGTGHE